MKALVLNGIGDENPNFHEIAIILENSLINYGFDVDTVRLIDHNIKRCRGCFGCWVKTPGECVVKDDSQLICRKIINSDYLIFLSPVIYGGYSSHLKKMVDKIIPLISPFFTSIHGETHHYPRYKKYPMILGVGIQNNYDNEEADCFRNIVLRNAINFHSPKAYADVFQPGDDELKISNSICKIFQ